MPHTINRTTLATQVRALKQIIEVKLGLGDHWTWRDIIVDCDALNS